MWVALRDPLAPDQDIQPLDILMTPLVSREQGNERPHMLGMSSTSVRIEIINQSRSPAIFMSNGAFYRSASPAKLWTAESLVLTLVTVDRVMSEISGL